MTIDQKTIEALARILDGIPYDSSAAGTTSAAERIANAIAGGEVEGLCVKSDDFIKRLTIDTLYATVGELTKQKSRAAIEIDMIKILVNELVKDREEFRSQLSTSESERMEQARLLGIGGEREAALMTQIASMKKEIERMHE